MTQAGAAHVLRMKVETYRRLLPEERDLEQHAAKLLICRACEMGAEALETLTGRRDE